MTTETLAEHAARRARTERARGVYGTAALAALADARPGCATQNGTAPPHGQADMIQQTKEKLT